jgi:hypothetical protein
LFFCLHQPLLHWGEKVKIHWFLITSCKLIYFNIIIITFLGSRKPETPSPSPYYANSPSPGTIWIFLIKFFKNIFAILHTEFFHYHRVWVINFFFVGEDEEDKENGDEEDGDDELEEDDKDEEINGPHLGNKWMDCCAYCTS